jgi:hypothetical protein
LSSRPSDSARCPDGDHISAATATRLAPSWNQFKGLRKARADSYGTKVAAIGRQDSVNAPSFGNGGNRAINQAEVEPCESCIQLYGSGDVGRKRWFILVSCSWIEDIRDQPSHGCTVLFHVS